MSTPRLLTRLLRAGHIRCATPLDPLFVNAILHEAGRAVPIVADNVSDYFYEGAPQEYWEPTDFPVLSPPFQMFWIEARGPARIVSAGKAPLAIPPDQRIDSACLFHGFTRQEFAQLADHLVRAVPGSPMAPFYRTLAERSCAWVLVWLFFGAPTAGDSSPTLVSQHGAMLDQAGAIVRTDSGGWINTAIYHTNVTNALHGPSDAAVMSYPHLLALSFMHCKNVHLTDPVPSDRYDRAARRRGDPAPLRFHTIQIEPLRTVLDRARRDSGGDLRHALHICRGHFKDYRAGSGLFGKRHGLFWWEHHLRGAPTDGIVMSDYRVNNPRSPADDRPAAAGTGTTMTSMPTPPTPP